jgi:transcriptional regulator with XRE-family HTH domain
MNYAAGIRAARQRAEFSQDTLAERAGCSQAAVSLIEARRHRPATSTVEALARGLGVSPLVLYLLSANGHDVPRGNDGIRIVGRISTLVDELWKHRRNGLPHKRG